MRASTLARSPHLVTGALLCRSRLPTSLSTTRISVMNIHPPRAAARLKVEAVPLGTFLTVQVTAVGYVLTALCQNGFHHAANGLTNGYQNKTSSGISAKFPIMLVYRTSRVRCYRTTKSNQVRSRSIRSELADRIDCAQLDPCPYGVCAAMWYYFNTPTSLMIEYANQLSGDCLDPPTSNVQQMAGSTSDPMLINL